MPELSLFDAKLRKLMRLLNVPHVDLKGFADELWSKYGHLPDSVFLNACLDLSQREFMRFPQLSHFRDAIGKAHEIYQNKINNNTKFQPIPEEDKPTPEQWKWFKDQAKLIGRPVPKVVYKTKNPHMIKEFEKHDERLKMKEQIKEARERREDPDFKFKKHFSQEE